MSVFDQKWQFLTKKDDYLITYAYFLPNKNTKVRAGMPSAKILGGKNDLYKKKSQNVSFWWQMPKNGDFFEKLSKK